MSPTELAPKQTQQEFPQNPQQVVEFRQHHSKLETIRSLGHTVIVVGAAAIVGIVGVIGYEVYEHVKNDHPSLGHISLNGTPPVGSGSEITSTFQSTPQQLECSAEVSVGSGVNVATHYFGGGYNENAYLPMQDQYCTHDAIIGDVGVESENGKPKELFVDLSQYQQTNISINIWSPLFCAQPPLTSTATKGQIDSAMRVYNRELKKGTENKDCYANQGTTGIGWASAKQPKEVQQVAEEVGEVSIAVTPISHSQFNKLAKDIKEDAVQDEKQQYPMVKEQNMYFTMPYYQSPLSQVETGFKSMAKEIETHFDKVQFTEQGDDTDLVMTDTNGTSGTVVIHQSFDKSQLRQLQRLVTTTTNSIS